MRELYCGCVLSREYCIMREEIVRERRGSYNECVVGCIPSFCWIIKRKDL
jgi:hypothetical protein